MAIVDEGMEVMQGTSAYNFSPAGRSASSSVDDGTSSWWTNTFNPTKAEQKFNAYQADVDRKFSAEQAEIARRFSSSEAQKQRDWEERLSSTAYSRSVADLRKNGLNPYLAVSGAPASTPTGASATGYMASSTGARATSHKGFGEDLITSLITSGFKLATSLLLK